METPWKLRKGTLQIFVSGPNAEWYDISSAYYDRKQKVGSQWEWSVAQQLVDELNRHFKKGASEEFVNRLRKEIERKTPHITSSPIKLKEILHRLKSENQEGLTELDNWKITDYDFMTDMDFKPDGQYHFALKSPHIKVSHKKGAGFVVEDYSKTNRMDQENTDVYDQPQEENHEPRRHVFPTFKDLSEYFTGYEQRWEHEPYKS